ncbi:MAG TPA: N-acetylmuramoyl-L-alanine amidase [Actinomycetota bacterium]|nr:N-acetylmuramoyl-L-alanine amidase [Actinomycetota bacterium]
MNPLARLLALLLVLALAGCTGGEPNPDPSTPGSLTPDAEQSPTEAPTTSPSPPPPPEPSPSPTVIGVDPAGEPNAPGVLRIVPAGTTVATAPGGSAAGRLRAGVVVPYSEVSNGWARITTPCELSRWMPLDSGERLARPTVVIDPGHGGDEVGAVGPGGLQEKELNLDVANRAVAMLNAAGIPTLATRTSDYRASLPFRVEVADRSSADLMISIHHNADPDGPLPKPGSETYYQIRSADSKRLAGLIYEEVVKSLSTLDVSWVGDTDAGAKYRLNSRGGDYYGILRRSAESGVTTVLAELAFVSNPAEEAVLRQDEIRRLEAEAIVRGVERYLRSQDPGTGFTTPYPRTAPAGPGGGTRGCVDPA